MKEIKVGKEDDSFYGSLISKIQVSLFDSPFQTSYSILIHSHLLSTPQFDKVLKYIETGKKEAKLETGGEFFRLLLDAKESETNCN